MISLNLHAHPNQGCTRLVNDDKKTSSAFHLLLHNDDVDGSGHVGRIDLAVPLLEGAVDPVEVRDEI
jgi:hypothetical protein